MKNFPAEYVEQLLIAMEENSITKLTLENDGVTINLSRQTDCNENLQNFNNDCIDNTLLLNIPEKQQSNDSNNYLNQNSNEEIVVKSTVVGLYHNTAEFKDGDYVQSGQKMGYIDIMGIKKDILAPVNGVIVNINIEDNSGVEYGEPLFSIIPA